MNKSICLFSWCLLHTIVAAAQEKPNILLIMTDQQTVSALSAAGNKDLHTPYTDYLAANGTMFTRAYVSQPVCSPSRTSIFCGKMPHETGFTANGSPKEGLWPAGLPTMGTVVRGAGYQTTYIGKWHIPIPEGSSNIHGFDNVSNTNLKNDYTDAVTSALCADFFREYNPSKGPFFMVASFLNPHDICEWARQDPLKMDIIPPLPPDNMLPALPANFEIPALEPAIVREQQHSNYRTYPSLKWDELQWRRYRWAYNRLIERVDHEVGRVINALKKYKLADDTIVIFTSDHGDGYAAHRWNQKQILYEESAGVPFIISRLGKWAPKVDSTTLICNGIDIIPTLCGAAGISKPGHLKGLNILDRIENPQSTWRDTLVIETEFVDNAKPLGIKGRAVITRDYKYIVYDKGEIREQLFNLRNDPGETKSLIREASAANILQKFRKTLQTWVKENGDDFKGVL